MKSYSVSIQMKATEQYFPVVLFIMLYKVVLTFESNDRKKAVLYSFLFNFFMIIACACFISVAVRG